MPNTPPLKAGFFILEAANMKKVPVLIPFVFIISGCYLFVAESDFYIDNQTDYPLTAVFEGAEGPLLAKKIPSMEKVKISSNEMIETKIVNPSSVYKSLAIYYAHTNNLEYKVYEQNPINDNLWSRTLENGYMYYIFELPITADMLDVP